MTLTDRIPTQIVSYRRRRPNEDCFGSIETPEA